MAANLVVNGGIRTVPDAVPTPKIYFFPASFNSGKATLALQISEKKLKNSISVPTLQMRDNYTPQYARLNPDTMAVPTMEIDDKVITDSFEICRYLRETYPGVGDREVVEAGRQSELLAVVDSFQTFDEYMYTYGSMRPSTSDTANGIRLAYLRIYLKQVLDEKPRDEEFLVKAYVKKFAGILTMQRATGGEADQDRKQKDMDENNLQLDKVLAKGSQLLGSGSGFLMSSQPSTADVYFLPIFRMFMTATPKKFDEVFTRYPNLKGYWTRAQEHPDVKEGLLDHVGKMAMLRMAFKMGIPKVILGYKCGCLKGPVLPDEVERRIQEAAEARWQETRG